MYQTDSKKKTKKNNFAQCAESLAQLFALKFVSNLLNVEIIRTEFLLDNKDIFSPSSTQVRLFHCEDDI